MSNRTFAIIKPDAVKMDIQAKSSIESLVQDLKY